MTWTCLSVLYFVFTQSIAVSKIGGRSLSAAVSFYSCMTSEAMQRGACCTKADGTTVWNCHSLSMANCRAITILV